ncbi:hypothetical protein SH2C18_22090 [Clostridium sediminicola]|uniref:TolC family protein n=1 Tax=Clostridium sediminicola TaxID=3114879 RepID=UPI0031F26AE9
MYRLIKKNKLSFFIITLVMVFFSVNAASANEAILNISRNEVGKMAVDYSIIVKNLENTRNKLDLDYEDLEDAMEMLEGLYNSLPRYKTLYNAYLEVESISNYQLYLEEAAKGIKGDIAAKARAEEMRKYEAPETDPTEEEKAKEAAAKVLDEALNNSNNMQVDEYIEYAQMQSYFSAQGITNPDLSPEEEYEKFIYPIYVVTRNMRTSILNLDITIDTAKASIYNGAVSIYDNILILEGYLQIQNMNYKSAQSDLNNAKRRYENGQIAKCDYDIALNKEKIAKLNVDSMKRKVENLKMNLNIFIGINPSTKVTFTSELDDKVALKSIDYYTEKALKERNEIVTLKNNYSAKLKEYEHIDDALSSSSEFYKIVDAELSDLELQEEQLEKQIKREIKAAYLNVLEKEGDLEISKLDIEDSKRQYDDMKLRVELGFVTEATLFKLDIMVTNANEAYCTAYSEYLAAVLALESASSIGPAFSGSKGGITFE